jgi:hypothetical protein
MDFHLLPGASQIESTTHRSTFSVLFSMPMVFRLALKLPHVFMLLVRCSDLCFGVHFRSRSRSSCRICFWDDLASRVRFFLPPDISYHLNSFFVCYSHLWQWACSPILHSGFCSEIYQGLPSAYPAREQRPHPSVPVFHLPLNTSFCLASFFFSLPVWVRSYL